MFDIILRSKANVPVAVVLKLVFFTLLMIFAPIASYYAGESLSIGLTRDSVSQHIV
jgi:hypothetical protein